MQKPPEPDPRPQTSAGLLIGQLMAVAMLANPAAASKFRRIRRGNKYQPCRCGSGKLMAHCCMRSK